MRACPGGSSAGGQPKPLTTKYQHPKRTCRPEQAGQALQRTSICQAQSEAAAEPVEEPGAGHQLGVGGGGGAEIGRPERPSVVTCAVKCITGL